MPLSPAPVRRRGQWALAVTLLTIVLWTARGLDPGATALLGVALLGLTGAAGGFRPTLAGFANPVPYFLVSVLAMGVAVAKSGLAERLARRILDHARGRALRVYVHLVLAMPVLTFVLPSATTRSGILVHIYYPVQSASALVIYERGHVSAGEILRFGLWMTALAYAVILFVALPYRGLVGQPLTQFAAKGRP